MGVCSLRPVLIGLFDFIAAKARQPDVRRAAEVEAPRPRFEIFRREVLARQQLVGGG